MQDHIELWQVKILNIGDVLYAVGFYESDGSPQEYKVITEPRTFERNKQRVEVQLQRGREKIWLTDECLEEFTPYKSASIPKVSKNV